MSKTSQLVTYGVSPIEIAETKARYAALSAETPAGYEEVRLAIAHVRDARVSIEKRRVELKADALAFGRLVDSEAKRITELFLEIEEPLKAKKAAVDDEKARIKAEAAAEKQRAIEAEIAAKRAVQEAEERAAREAEVKRLAEERTALEAERKRLEAEREKFEAEQKADAERIEATHRAERERLRAEREAEEAKAAVLRKAEQDRIDAEREKLAAEKRAEEDRARAERKALEAERKRLTDEKAAAEKAERDRIEAAERAEFERRAKIVAEQEAREKLERDRVEAARLAAEREAMKPDMEKLRVFARSIRGLKIPEVDSPRIYALLACAFSQLIEVAEDLDLAADEYTSETQEEAA